MITLREQIHTYIPYTADEQKAKAHILRQWDVLGDEIFARPDEGHFTASSIILNKERTHMLMVYHNIYDSFSWTGGHADGTQNLLQRAIEEAKEETGIATLIPLTGAILSMDVLPVKAHVKRGKEIKAHQHYNIAYGFIASDQEQLQIKPDENSNVCWIALDGWQSRCNEAHMIPVYEKIISRMQELDSVKQHLYSRLPELLFPWFLEHARKLPWREDRDPYHVWLSEIMLQQTRVEAVKGYYQRFLTALPDIKALADAQEDLLMKLWEGLGYYSRVRNLQKAARVIMTEHDGVFPSDYKAMLALPGIGEYTAGAIGSVCFDLPEPAVDGNVLRIISRITENYNNILSPAMKKEITQTLRSIYPAGESAYLFNQSMMELGATVCVPNGAPKCDICPVQQICMAYANHTWELLPQKEAKKKRKIEYKTVFVLQSGGKTAVEKRSAKGLLAGLWQYPNIEGTLDVQAALDIAASWQVKPVVVQKELHDKHIFTHVEWHMVCYYLECESENTQFTWVNADALQNEIALPTAFKKFSL